MGERNQRELLKNLLEAGFSQPPTNNKLKTTISRVAKTTNKSIIKVAKKMAVKLASRMVRQIDQKLHLQNASKFKHGSKSFTDSYTSAAAPTSAYASTHKTGAGPMKKPKMVVRLPTAKSKAAYTTAAAPKKKPKFVVRLPTVKSKAKPRSSYTTATAPISSAAKQKAAWLRLKKRLKAKKSSQNKQ